MGGRIAFYDPDPVFRPGSCRQAVWMKKLLLLLSTLLLFSLGGRAAASLAPERPEIIRLRDTLRTDGQRFQFRRALELAPQHFVCEKYQSDGRSYATVRRLRFNDTMRRVLKFDFVQQDAFLHRQMRKFYLVTRPFGVSGDLTVRYKTLSDGALAVQYDISNLYIWGHRASDRLIRELLKANADNGK